MKKVMMMALALLSASASAQAADDVDILRYARGKGFDVAGGASFVGVSKEGTVRYFQEGRNGAYVLDDRLMMPRSVADILLGSGATTSTSEPAPLPKGVISIQKAFGAARYKQYPVPGAMGAVQVDDGARIRGEQPDLAGALTYCAIALNDELINPDSLALDFVEIYTYDDGGYHIKGTGELKNNGGDLDPYDFDCYVRKVGEYVYYTVASR